ncbi:TrmH family RNA methyltransferase [Oryzibacter oryziterrae]|uniref:TrmH family RNA methyltransferase n=1 Tax=Oryzibacter oryziterrae TaxID=2766474 RepID=UPI001F1C806C|nr:RNA methyltransferase [Oryzibacter oryziterrae]
MNVFLIDAPDDPRIAPYMNIRDRDLNDAHGGGFIAEGESVLNVFLRQDRFETVSLLVAQSRLKTVEAMVGDNPLPVYAAPQAVMDAIVGFPIHRGLLGLGRRGTPPTSAELLKGRPPLVLGLAGIANHDNMGGIFRNAAAFGVGAVLLDATCCDPLYRKALRVSVGGCLAVPYARAAADQSLVTLLSDAGYVVYGLSPRGSIRLDQIDRDRPAALLLGAEGPGLTDAVLDAVTSVRIDMSGGFDSLNVATTSGIALYEMTRRA